MPESFDIARVLASGRGLAPSTRALLFAQAQAEERRGKFAFSPPDRRRGRRPRPEAPPGEDGFITRRDPTSGNTLTRGQGAELQDRVTERDLAGRIAERRDIRRLRETTRLGLLTDAFRRQPEAFESVFEDEILGAAGDVFGQADSLTEFAERNQQSQKQRAGRAAAEREAIRKYGETSSATEGQLEDLVEQHRRKFPEFADTANRPLSKREQLAQFRQQEEESFQADLDQVTSAFGIGKIGSRRNKDGILEPIVDPVKLAQIQRSSRQDERQAENDRIALDLKMLELSAPKEPDAFSTAQDIARFGLHRARIAGTIKGIKERQQEQLAEEEAPVDRIDIKVMRKARRRSREEEIDLVLTEEDLAEIEPGAAFIDARDGRRYTKNKAASAATPQDTPDKGDVPVVRSQAEFDALDTSKGPVIFFDASLGRKQIKQGA